MIRYDNRDLRHLLFSRAGAVVFSSYVLVPSLLSTILCAVILLSPNIKDNMIIAGDVGRIYAQMLGFVIVFRTNMSFNRYFDGVAHVKVMLSKWRDSYATLSVFIEVSLDQWQERGAVEYVQELWMSKARMIHWFSLLVAITMQKLSKNDTLLEGLQPRELKNRLEPSKRRFSHTSFASSSSLSFPSLVEVEHSRSGPRPRRIQDSMRMPVTCSREPDEDEEADYDSDFLVLGELTPWEEEALANSQDEILMVLRWLKMEISRHAITGSLSIPPPIISRVYQELSNGMLYFCMAMKFVLVPFPFPFAQLLQYALLLFVVLCPFAVLPSLDVLPDPDEVTLSKTWTSLVTNFLAVAGFVALNEIAVELEEPFGEDPNDFPLHQEQQMFLWALEDCFFLESPKDFQLRHLGQDAMKAGQRLIEAVQAELDRKEEAAAAAAATVAPPASAPASSTMPAAATTTAGAGGTSTPPMVGVNSFASTSTVLVDENGEPISCVARMASGDGFFQDGDQFLNAEDEDQSTLSEPLIRTSPAPPQPETPKSEHSEAFATPPDEDEEREPNLQPEPELEPPTTREGANGAAAATPAPAPAAPAPAAPAPAVPAPAEPRSILPNFHVSEPQFEELQDMVCQSILSLEGLAEKRLEDISSLSHLVRALEPSSRSSQAGAWDEAVHTAHDTGLHPLYSGPSGRDRRFELLQKRITDYGKLTIGLRELLDKAKAGGGLSAAGGVEDSDLFQFGSSPPELGSVPPSLPSHTPWNPTEASPNSVRLPSSQDQYVYL